MASDAVVNLVVNAAGADATITAQMRAIVNDAERSAPAVHLRVDIDQAQVVSALRRLETATDDQTDRLTNALSEGFGDLTTQLAARLDLLSGQLGDLDDSINRVDRSLHDLNDASGDADHGLVTLTGHTDDADRSNRRLTSTFLGGAAAAATMATRLTLISGAAAGALPIVGALATSVASIVPAAAAGVTAFVAMKAATLTLKVALTGVDEAISAVFDPDADPEAVAEALKHLSTNARNFVLELQKLKPALDDLRLDVQDRVFKGLDKTLAVTAKSTLPVLRKASLDFASTFNAMAKNTGAAAQDLAESGTLGKALKSGSDAFARLQRIPGQVLTAIGNLAVGGGPLLNKLTDKIADVADSLSVKLSKAAKSGALQDAIDEAADTLAQLGRVAGNVFEALGNVMEIASEHGGGLFGTLEKVTQALVDLTETTEFEETLGSLVDLGQTLATEILPLLALAFDALAPVVQVLAPVLEQIVTLLGDQLAELIPELAPLLETMAELFGQILLALSPLIESGVQILIDIMPNLNDLFSALIDLVVELTPFISYLAEGLVYLSPLIGIVIDAITGWILIITEAIGWITDLIEVLGDLTVKMGGDVTAGIKSVSQLLDGDFAGSLDTASANASSFSLSAAGAFHNLSVKAIQEQSGMFAQIQTIASNGWAGFVNSALSRTSQVVGIVAGLRDKIVGYTNGLAQSLYNAGANMISSLAHGMLSQLQQSVDAASKIVSSIRDFFPFSPARRGPFSGRGYPRYSGQALIGSFAQGILDSSGVLQDALSSTLGISTATQDIGLSLSPAGAAGQGGALAAAASRSGAVTAPNVAVYLGNELVRQYVKVVVDDENAQRDRLAAQGIRG